MILPPEKYEAVLQAQLNRVLLQICCHEIQYRKFISNYPKFIYCIQKYFKEQNRTEYPSVAMQLQCLQLVKSQHCHGVSRVNQIQVPSMMFTISIWSLYMVWSIKNCQIYSNQHSFEYPSGIY